MEREKPKDIQILQDIETIGNGNIGEKAKQLAEKTPFLKELGFRVPRRTFLAQDFFDGFFQKNGLGESLTKVNHDSDLEAKIISGMIPTDDFAILQKITTSYGETPLVIRSSAQGDARGTGIYKSEFSENKIEEVRKALQKVLASYFSKDAIAFRKDANTGDGFGIIIEPIVGQNLSWYISPVISGYGYTSTSRGEGYIAVVPGLGCAVESKVDERITKDQSEQHGQTLGDYVFPKRRETVHDGWNNSRKSALLRTDQLFGISYNAKVFWPSAPPYRPHAEVIDGSIDYPNDVEKALYDLNLKSFFHKMGEVEQAFGKPQYLEWAVTIESEKPTYWIIQIADVDKKLDVLEFEDFGKPMFIGHTVTGTGIKDSSKIALCWNFEDIDCLDEFNKKNKDYILIFLGRLTTSMIESKHKKLSYRNFSNASVFLEIPYYHLGRPIAHLEGQLDMVGKIFGVLDYHAEIPPDWESFNKNRHEEDGLTVCDGRFKTIGSEKQNRIVVYDRK